MLRRPDGSPSLLLRILWARTVTCKNCRATIPLLKTCWLAKKASKRVRLGMQPNVDRSAVDFRIESNLPISGGNNAQRREHDRKLGQGTMSRAGAWCPCCGRPGTVAMEIADIRAEGAAGRLGTVLTAVVLDGPDGKEVRLPTKVEVSVANPPDEALQSVFEALPFDMPQEPTPVGGGTGAGRAFSVHAYGLTRWNQLFTRRQLLAHGSFIATLRRVKTAVTGSPISPDLASRCRATWLSHRTACSTTALR